MQEPEVLMITLNTTVVLMKILSIIANKGFLWKLLTMKEKWFMCCWTMTISWKENFQFPTRVMPWPASPPGTQTCKEKQKLSIQGLAKLHGQFKKLAINLGSFNIEVFLIHMQLTTNKNEQNRHNGKGFEWCTFTVFLIAKLHSSTHVNLLVNPK